MASSSSLRTFNRLCWVLIFYTVLVIIWGAWVRISHSGNGCGNHWPLCEGVFIPSTENKKTLIEFFHRLTSGFYGIFVTGLFIASNRLFPRHTATRQVALATFVLMIFEALLGAALVLKGLVGENATIFRLAVMTFHQLNSLLLTGSTVALALVSLPQEKPETLHVSWKGLLKQKINWLLFILIPATGAWASLANTLFPSHNLQEGLIKDFTPHIPWILRLRVIHPLLALAIGIYLIYWFFNRSDSQRIFQRKSPQAAFLVGTLLSIAVLFGIMTLLSLSPIWMKLVHLTFAQIVWILIVRYVIISLLSTSRYST